MPSRELAPGTPGYPDALLALGSPERAPPTLWVRGPLPEGPGVAIVGTREASEEALAFTRELAAGLVGQGVVVWSGGALGIDGAAHEAALDAGGRTVVVMGGGLDRPYPPQHEALFARVLEQGGALVSRVRDDTPPMAPLFLARNEVLAALTKVTVVVEAGIQSGARSTAAAARRIGRTLCVVPHAPWDERGHGCTLELAKGALPALGAAEVLVALGLPAPPPARRLARAARRAKAGRSSSVKSAPRASLPLPLGDFLPAPSPALELEGDELNVFNTLSSTPTHADHLCDRTGLPRSVVAGVLLTLTLRAVVVEGPAGFFRRSPRLS